MRALRRLLWGLGVLALAAGAFWLWVVWPSGRGPGGGAARPVGETVVEAAAAWVPPPLVDAPVACDARDRAPANAAAANAASLQTLAWSPFGKPETGWEIYAPRIAAEVGTGCAPDSEGFAAALARWQDAHGLARTGVMDEAVFDVMLPAWHLSRPFVRVNREGVCPGAPAETSLAVARPEESYGGKTIQLRPAALEAYRRMAAEARAAGVLHRPEALRIYSGFRAPDADAERCARDRNCQGLARAICSAHRTGLALDLFIDAAPGFGPDSSADANRLAMARSPLYRWMVANAGRFGFVNYVYEPWHWEWTGEPLLPGTPIDSLPQDGAEPITEPAEGSTPRTPAAASGARPPALGQQRRAGRQIAADGVALPQRAVLVDRRRHEDLGDRHRVIQGLDLPVGAAALARSTLPLEALGPWPWRPWAAFFRRRARCIGVSPSGVEASVLSVMMAM